MDLKKKKKTRKHKHNNIKTEHFYDYFISFNHSQTLIHSHSAEHTISIPFGKRDFVTTYQFNLLETKSKRKKLATITNINMRSVWARWSKTTMPRRKLLNACLLDLNKGMHFAFSILVLWLLFPKECLHHIRNHRYCLRQIQSTINYNITFMVGFLLLWMHCSRFLRSWKHHWKNSRASK